MCVDIRRRSLETNVNDGFVSGEETIPETPPPSYSSIVRHMSIISDISQTSAQRKFMFAVIVFNIFFIFYLNTCFVAGLIEIAKFCNCCSPQKR